MMNPEVSMINGILRGDPEAGGSSYVCMPDSAVHSMMQWTALFCFDMRWSLMPGIAAYNEMILRYLPYGRTIETANKDFRCCSLALSSPSSCIFGSVTVTLPDCSCWGNYSAPPLTRNASRFSLWAIRGASRLGRPMNSQKSSGE